MEAKSGQATNFGLGIGLNSQILDILYWNQCVWATFKTADIRSYHSSSSKHIRSLVLGKFRLHELWQLGSRYVQKRKNSLLRPLCFASQEKFSGDIFRQKRKLWQNMVQLSPVLHHSRSYCLMATMLTW